MKTVLFRVATALSVTLLLAGCGFKGDLVLEDENVPKETSEPGATDVKKTDDNLLVFHVNMEAGHGGKSGRFQRYREIALEYAFFLDQLGVPVKSVKAVSP